MRFTDTATQLLRLNSQAAFAIVVALSAIPLWIPQFLPFVDVPQHAAQVASLHELLGGNAYLAESLEINWFTPYLGGYLLLYLASAVLPIVPALKLVVTIAVVAVPLLTGAILRSVGADERLKWLAIPGSYSFALYWGFMVYVVAVPVALALLLLTVSYERRPTLARALGVAAFCIGLFFCHVIALGFGALISLTWITARNFRSPLRLLRCALPYTAPIPLIGYWLFGVYSSEASVQGSPIIFAPMRERLTVLFDQFAGLDGAMFAVGMAVAAAVVALPIAFGYRPSRRIERWLPFVAGLAVYLVFPYYMQSTAYLYQRLAVFLIPLWLMLWDPPRKTHVLFGASTMLVVFAWLWANTDRFAGFAREASSFAAVLEEIEPGKRVGGMLLCNGAPGFRYPVVLHFHAWYQALSAGIADNSFAMTHPSLIRYRDFSKPRLDDDLAWQPQNFDWVRNGGDDYDFFIVCAAEDYSPILFREKAPSIELVAHDNRWWLYKNMDRSAL